MKYNGPQQSGLGGCVTPLRTKQSVKQADVTEGRDSYFAFRRHEEPFQQVTFKTRREGYHQAKTTVVGKGNN